MTIGTLDRRLVFLLLGSVVLILILRLGVYRDRAEPVVAAVDSIPVAERRLEKLRDGASTIPGKAEVLKLVRAEAEAHEKGMLKADTMAQAQAQLLSLTQAVAKANGIDTRGGEEFRNKILSDDYGEVSVAVTFTCGIEQLVNLLAALGNQPEILATNEIHVNGGNDKKKNVQVRLSVSALVSRKLLPEKKG